jgi:ribosomal protein S18 acetylase RimI-like enzyme
VIRDATPQDEPALRELDLRTWSWRHSPAPPRERPFDTEGVLIDERDGALAGYVKVAPLWPIASVAHVRQINDITVDPVFRRRGVGRALVAAAAERARAEGARKLTLRVLGHNTPARHLYAASGFEVEGVLRDLFYLEGAYVDDVVMSLDLT